MILHTISRYFEKPSASGLEMSIVYFFGLRVSGDEIFQLGKISCLFETSILIIRIYIFCKTRQDCFGKYHFRYFAGSDLNFIFLNEMTSMKWL